MKYFKLYNTQFDASINISKINYCSYQIKVNTDKIYLYQVYNVRKTENCQREFLEITSDEFNNYFTKTNIQPTAILKINKCYYSTIIKSTSYQNETLYLETTSCGIDKEKNMISTKLPLGQNTSEFFIEHIRLNFNKCLKSMYKFKYTIGNDEEKVKPNLTCKKFRELKKCGATDIEVDNHKYHISNSSPEYYNSILEGLFCIKNNIMTISCFKLLIFQIYNSCNLFKNKYRGCYYASNNQETMEYYAKKWLIPLSATIKINGTYYPLVFCRVKFVNKKFIIKFSTGQSKKIPNGTYQTSLFIDGYGNCCPDVTFNCKNSQTWSESSYVRECGSPAIPSCLYSHFKYRLRTIDLAKWACGSCQNVKNISSKNANCVFKDIPCPTTANICINSY